MPFSWANGSLVADFDRSVLRCHPTPPNDAEGQRQSDDSDGRRKSDRLGLIEDLYYIWPLYSAVIELRDSVGSLTPDSPPPGQYAPLIQRSLPLSESWCSYRGIEGMRWCDAYTAQ